MAALSIKLHTKDETVEKQNTSTSPANNMARHKWEASNYGTSGQQTCWARHQAGLYKQIDAHSSNVYSTQQTKCALDARQRLEQDGLYRKKDAHVRCCNTKEPTSNRPLERVATYEIRKVGSHKFVYLRLNGDQIRRLHRGWPGAVRGQAMRRRWTAGWLADGYAISAISTSYVWLLRGRI